MPSALTIDEFEPLAWINNYTQPAIQISDATFGPILHFSLMWNLFERDVCGRDAKPDKIEKAVQSAFAEGYLELDPFKEHLAYFRARSQRDGMSIDRYLDALKMDNKNARHLVRGVLKGDILDANNTLYALLLIAHRIRNNLFHGEKEVAILNSQSDLFRAVNSLLATYLSVTKSSV